MPNMISFEIAIGHKYVFKNKSEFRSIILDATAQSRYLVTHQFTSSFQFSGIFIPT